ncbi:hypothetical protein B0T10DRAFT_462569 [Thelonectria olida]|uniref:Uncharacterized protein n=1 Tax=Thelonectria olida TaxID=1576542 RepID=A0A9P8W0Z2_9HYPO|nr:hypothetical protein B0T10DRAFT_462569 [Thelonectria olida]
MSARVSSNQDKPDRQSSRGFDETSHVHSTRGPQRTFEEECQRLAVEVANLPRFVQSSLGGNHNTNRDYDGRMSSQLQEAHRDVQHKDTIIRDLERQLESREMEIQDLRSREQSLRDFVLESQQYQEVSHEEVISAFAQVRQDAQKIASSRLYQLDEKTLDFEHNKFAAQIDFSVLWSKSTRKDRLLVLRSLIFQILVDRPLSYRGFGITTLDANQAKLPDSVAKMDIVMRQFEDTLIHREVPTDVITNWRLLTLRAVEVAGMKGNMLGATLAEQMYDFFATLIKDEATDEERAKLRNAFGQLCHDAFALQLLMRKSKTNYQCIPLESGRTASKWEHAVDVFAELDGRPNGEAKIAFTLFGALVITPSSRDDTQVVLEKAQVVVKRR